MIASNKAVLGNWKEVRRMGNERTWYQISPGIAVAVAVLLFAIVTLLHWYQDGSGQAIVVLYVLPISLLAVTFGFRGGMFGAATGFTLFVVLEVAHSSGDIDATGWIVRGVAMVLLGGLLGRATDKTIASQQTALQEQRERCRLEEANRRYIEAMEISDSLIQKMVAAKWMAEQGKGDKVIEVLTTTILEAEDMVVGLLDKQVAGPTRRGSDVSTALSFDASASGNAGSVTTRVRRVWPR